MGEDVSDQEDILLGGEYEVVTIKKSGTLFIEARIRDDLEEEVDTATVLHPSSNLSTQLPYTFHFTGSRRSRAPVVQAQSSV